MRELHRSGLFYHKRNGVLVSCIPESVRCYRVYEGERTIEIFYKKIFFFDRPSQVLEVEEKDGQLSYFKYDSTSKRFVLC